MNAQNENDHEQAIPPQTPEEQSQELPAKSGASARHAAVAQGSGGRERGCVACHRRSCVVVVAEQSLPKPGGRRTL